MTAAARLSRLLDRFAGRRVLVVGDVILDEYLHGDAARISPEAPIPVVRLTSETHLLGGAGYVASHVRHLGGEAVLCGVAGRDPAGDAVRALLRERGIDAAGLVTDPGRPTSIKTRVVAKRQQMLRIDRERTDPIAPETAAALLRHAEQALPAVDVVICSDYDKGAFTPSLIRRLLSVARWRRVPVAVNPKPRLATRFRGATLVSMNQAEAAAVLGRPLPDEAAVRAAGPALRRRLGAAAVLVTRGEHGMALFTSGAPRFVPARAREVFDVTGAGDTVIAVAAMGLAARGRLADAVQLASAAAAVEVGKLGCALVSRAEILKELRRG
jgi:rfaE bifunctional protein kinase chain/domain